MISYLARPTAGDNIIILDRALNDHNGIMQTSLHLGDELLGSTPKNERARLCLGATLKEVETLATNLPLFEPLASAKMVGLDI